MQTENVPPEYRKSSGPDLSNVPVELRSYRNFVGWKYEEVKRRDGTVKTTKVPYVIGDHGRRASSTKPDTWTTYEEAYERASDFNGVGFSIENTPFCGFDFDDCRDKQTGEIKERFRCYINRVDSYTEVTPSGEGVRVWVRGKLPADASRHEFIFDDGSSVELYDSGRYFTLTGDHLEGTPRDIRGGDVATVYAEITADFSSDAAEKGQRRMAEQASASSNNAEHYVEQFLRRHGIKILRTKRRASSTTFEIECKGTHGGYEKDDGKSFVKVFSSGDVFAGCLHKSCSYNNSENHWHELRRLYAPDDHNQDKSELVVVRGDQVAERTLSFFWPPYLPLGKLAHFGGNSSQAKSPVSIDIAARVTSGSPWPDGSPNVLGPRSVILLNIEDDVEDTILPRFRLAGGDKTKFLCVKGTRVRRESGILDRGVALDSDMRLLVDLAQSTADLGLIILDPITNYLGMAKMNAEEDVRRILTPLANLAAKLSIVVITVGHFNRREKGTDPLHRIMGAAAFAGVARAVYAFGPDPDSSDKHAHVMTVVRGCGSDPSALRYKTELVRDTAPDCPTNDIIRVVWCGKSNATAEDAVDPAPADVKAQETKAAELIKDFLREPPCRRPSKECEAFLVTQGLNVDHAGKLTLNLSRVRKQASVQTRKFPGERFYSWYLEAVPDQSRFI